MEFINYQKIASDETEVKNSLQKMEELAKVIIDSGLNVSANEILKIATGRLSLAMLFQAEARERTKGSPKYVVDEALSLAVNQANKHIKEERAVRENAQILYRLKPEKFVMNEDCVFSYSGDLKAELTAIHTRKLDEKQINMVKGVEAFQKALNDFNELLVEAGYSHLTVNVSTPLTLGGKPDLEKISKIDYEHIEAKKEAVIQASIKQKEERETQRKRLEKLYPKNYEDRENHILKMLAVDPDGSKYDDDFHRNLIEPTKGTFKRTKNLA